MPALRTISILAACLAQAWAGPQYGGSNSDPNQGGRGGNDNPSSDNGGHGGGRGQDVSTVQADAVSDMGMMTMTMTVTETMMMPTTVFQAAGDMSISTVTITAVQPCTASAVVTAYVSNCDPPPGFPGPPPGAGGSVPVPNGAAPIITTFLPNFVPGLSSIPTAEAFLTGVTVKAAPPAAAATTVSAAALSASPPGPPAGAPSPPPYGAPYGAAPVDMSMSMPPFTGSSFTTTGTIALGLSTIAKTDGVVGAAVTPAPPGSPPAAAPTGTVTFSNAGVLGIGKRSLTLVALPLS